MSLGNLIFRFLSVIQRTLRWASETHNQERKACSSVLKIVKTSLIFLVFVMSVTNSACSVTTSHELLLNLSLFRVVYRYRNMCENKVQFFLAHTKNLIFSIFQSLIKIYRDHFCSPSVFSTQHSNQHIFNTLKKLNYYQIYFTHKMWYQNELVGSLVVYQFFKNTI